MIATKKDRCRLKGNGVADDPLAVSVADAVKLSGIGRTMLYADLKAGKIRAVKHGAKTLVLVDSLRAHLASLPTATFTPKQSAV